MEKHFIKQTPHRERFDERCVSRRKERLEGKKKHLCLDEPKPLVFSHLKKVVQPCQKTGKGIEEENYFMSFHKKKKNRTKKLKDSPKAAFCSASLRKG